MLELTFNKQRYLINWSQVRYVEELSNCCKIYFNSSYMRVEETLDQIAEMVKNING